jgi:hypothetical protein
MALPPIYKIHPSIGVARVGNSPDDFFVGPELPGRPPEGDKSIGSTVPAFKDKDGRIKRQGARFRVFRYTDNGKGKYEPDVELNLDSKDVESIEWTVHLANKKAGFFLFRTLLGDPDASIAGVPPKRRNASVTDPKKLWIDPGKRAVRGRNARTELRKGVRGSLTPEHWPTPAPSPAIETLGELRTDGAGRLVVLGGFGVASSLTGAKPIGDFANNDGWFDDVSDGPVNATIKLKGVARPVQAAGAWVLCGPPCFAPFTEHVVTLWDTLFDVAAREMTLPANDARFDGALKSLALCNQDLFGTAAGVNTIRKYVPVFEQDIWPILRRAIDAAGVFRPLWKSHATLGARGGVGAIYPSFVGTDAGATALRQFFFGYLHEPGDPTDGMPNHSMPKLLGDDPRATWKIMDRRRLTLTSTQHAMMNQWARGKFTSSTKAPPPRPTGTITADGLDLAALEHCVGGAFSPGIECSWLIRNPKIYAEPFRIKEGAPGQYVGDTSPVDAGYFSRQMALPWHADFRDCRQSSMPVDSNPSQDTEWGWWPVHRPTALYVSKADAQKPTNVMYGWARSTKGGVFQRWASGGIEDPTFMEMITVWTKFGFVVKDGDLMYETERAADVP